MSEPFFGCLNRFQAFRFSDLAYELPPSASEKSRNPLLQEQLTEGWSEIDVTAELSKSKKSSEESGLYLRTFLHHSGVLVTAFRGTEPTDISDLGSDAVIGAYPNSYAVPQVKQALTFVNALTGRHFGNVKITRYAFTGHSLGGLLAVMAANEVGSGSLAVPFDAPTTSLSETKAEVHSFVNRPNPVNLAGFGEHLGSVYRPPSFSEADHRVALLCSLTSNTVGLSLATIHTHPMSYIRTWLHEAKLFPGRHPGLHQLKQQELKKIGTIGKELLISSIKNSWYEQGTDPALFREGILPDSMTRRSHIDPNHVRPLRPPW